MTKKKRNFEKELFSTQVHCANNHADYKRVVEWMDDPNRKPALIEFTAGPERQLGYAFEAQFGSTGYCLECERRARESK